MSTFAPYTNRSLADIFDEKIPAVDGCTYEDDVNAKEKCIVSPELVASTVGEVQCSCTYKMMRLLVPDLWYVVLVARAVPQWWLIDGCFCINFSLDLNNLRIEYLIA